MELPIAFENRMKQLLGDAYGDFLAALREERDVKGLRVNTNKIPIAEFEANAPLSQMPLPYVKGGYVVDEDARAGKHPYHQAGAYYLQDPGAMATVAALPEGLLDKPNLKILDLCAAPGGKTTQLAAAVASKGGVVLANEYVSSRSRILAGNVERMGLDNVCVTNLDSAALAKQYPNFFDLVVVDAPCSGEGMFRKNDLAISEWSPENVAMCARRQEEILNNALRCVSPGGHLLYSTCTYSTEENEETVAAFLSAHPEFSLVSCHPTVVECTADGVRLPDSDPDLSLCRRFYPHVSPGEGQFVALMALEGERGEYVRKKAASTPSLSKPQQAAADGFLKETLGHTLSPLLLRHGYLSAFPILEQMDFPLPPQTVAVGVPLGEERKGRIVPHHHFFMRYGKDCLSQIALDPTDERVSRYLAGEEIDIPRDLKGYTAVLLRMGNTALTLGGGKAVDGRLKNYYPKGLRIK